MDARPTFYLDLSEDNKPKPVQQTVISKFTRAKKVKLLDYYVKHDADFYDVVSKCAEYIDKISCPATKLSLQNDLSKIFVIRHKVSLMRLFLSLVNMKKS